eukprot:5295949-Karenia_brevis.AAC.1
MRDLDFLIQHAVQSAQGLQQVFRCSKALVATSKTLQRDKPDRAVTASKTIRKTSAAYLEC